MHTQTSWPADVLTLSIDIGGSGFKASVVSAQGVMTQDRVRVDTPYPCPSKPGDHIHQRHKGQCKEGR